MRSALTRTAVPIGFVTAALLVVSSPNTSPTLSGSAFVREQPGDSRTSARPRRSLGGGGQSPGTWKPLFNGKDLSGWTVAAGRRGGTPSAATPDAAAPPPVASWKVEDGVLVGGQGTRGSLVSNEQFKDFELELDFMLAEHGTQCSAELRW